MLFITLSRGQYGESSCILDYHFTILDSQIGWLVGWLCLVSHQQRGHLETGPPFTVPCEGREARFLHRSDRESNPGPSRGSRLHYRCATPAPPSLEWTIYLKCFSL